MAEPLIIAKAGDRDLALLPGLANRLAPMIMRFLPRRFLMDAVGRYNRKRYTVR